MIDAFINECMTWIGTPYLHDSGVKNAGCDCVNLPYQAYQDATGVKLPKLKPYNPQFYLGAKQKMLDEIYSVFKDYVTTVYKDYKRGDILLICLNGRIVCHVAVYLGNDMVIEATGSTRCVVKHRLDHKFKKRIHSALRLRGIK